MPESKEYTIIYTIFGQQRTAFSAKGNTPEEAKNNFIDFILRELTIDEIKEENWIEGAVNYVRRWGLKQEKSKS